MSRKHQSVPILYAYDNRTGRLIHIDKTMPGQEGLMCPSPSCRHPMTPVKKVTQKIPHFRHKGDGFGNPDRLCKDPEGINESIVHELGKLVILQRQSLLVQPKEHIFEQYRGQHLPPVGLSAFKKNTVAKLSDVALEKRLFRSDYQADVSARIRIPEIEELEPIIIEICYQNPVGDQRLEKIREMDIAAVEINLKELDEPITYAEVEHVITHSKRAFKWLHYPARWNTTKDLENIQRHEALYKQKIDIKHAQEERDRIEREKENAEKKRKAEAERKRRAEEIELESAVDAFNRLVKIYVSELVTHSQVSPVTEADKKLISEYSALKLKMQEQLKFVESIVNHTGNILYKNFGADNETWVQPAESLRSQPHDYLSTLESFTHQYRSLVSEALSNHLLYDGSLFKQLEGALKQKGLDLNLINHVASPNATTDTNLSEPKNQANMAVQRTFEKVVWVRCRVIVKQELSKLPKGVN